MLAGDERDEEVVCGASPPAFTLAADGAGGGPLGNGGLLISGFRGSLWLRAKFLTLAH